MSLYCTLFFHAETERERDGRHIQDKCSRCGEVLRERMIPENVFNEVPAEVWGTSNAGIPP